MHPQLGFKNGRGGNPAQPGMTKKEIKKKGQERKLKLN
jgi:hypothetical protein